MRQRGSTLECWKDFAKTLPSGTRRCTEDREGLRSFLGISHSTLRRYITDPEVLNRGLPLVKIRYFLEALGYTVTELEKMDKLARKFGELVAFDIMDIPGATKNLRYKNENGVFRILHGESPELPEDRAKAMQGMINFNEDTLKKKIDHWHKIWGIKSDAVTEVPDAVQVVETTRVESNGHTKTSAQDEVTIFAGLAKALQPVVENLLSKADSPEARKRLREAVGANTLFRLSTGLNRLGSEAANQQYSITKGE